MTTAKDIISTEFPRMQRIDKEIAEMKRDIELVKTVQKTLSCPIELAHHVTDPSHGGKVTCHKCNGFIIAAEHEGYWDHQHKDEFPKYHFHKRCFNQYEHYYGLDKILD